MTPDFISEREYMDVVSGSEIPVCLSGMVGNILQLNGILRLCENALE
jgi:hypothetical protein